MKLVANYAAAKQAAAQVILAHPALIYVENRGAVERAAAGQADRDVMFSLALAHGRFRAGIDIVHTYDDVPETCHDEAGNTLQACRLRARVSWKAMEKGDPFMALQAAEFQLHVARLADAVNSSFMLSGIAWEVIMPAPARVSRDEAA